MCRNFALQVAKKTLFQGRGQLNLPVPWNLFPLRGRLDPGHDHNMMYPPVHPDHNTDTVHTDLLRSTSRCELSLAHSSQSRSERSKKIIDSCILAEAIQHVEPIR